MTWADGPILGFDLETTGPEPEHAHVVTATLLTCPPCPRGTDERPQVTEWLADPGIEIPDGAAEVHGITTDHARTHGRPEHDVVAELLAWLDRHWHPAIPLVIFNAPYDLTVLDRRARAHGLLGPDGLKIRGPVVDPLLIDRTHPRSKYRKAGKGGRRLIKAAAHYGCPLSEDDAHNSTADTLAAVRVARAIARRFPDVGRTDLRQLYRIQVLAARKWAPEMQAYLRRTNDARAADDPERVDTESILFNPHWPLIPYAPETIT